MRRRSTVALLAALMVMAMTLGASAALAGEVNGNGDETAAKYHGRSACLYSGLEDGPFEPGTVQNWGHTKDAPVVLDAPRGASYAQVNFGEVFWHGCNPILDEGPQPPG